MCNGVGCLPGGVKGQFSRSTKARTMAALFFLSLSTSVDNPPDSSSSHTTTVLPLPSGWTSGPDSSTANVVQVRLSPLACVVRNAGGHENEVDGPSVCDAAECRVEV